MIIRDYYFLLYLRFRVLGDFPSNPQPCLDLTLSAFRAPVGVLFHFSVPFSAFSWSTIRSCSVIFLFIFLRAISTSSFFYFPFGVCSSSAIEEIQPSRFDFLDPGLLFFFLFSFHFTSCSFLLSVWYVFAPWDDVCRTSQVRPVSYWPLLCRMFCLPYELLPSVSFQILLYWSRIFWEILYALFLFLLSNHLFCLMYLLCISFPKPEQMS